MFVLIGRVLVGLSSLSLGCGGGLILFCGLVCCGVVGCGVVGRVVGFSLIFLFWFSSIKYFSFLLVITGAFLKISQK